ncbi:hypothetical protein [Nocardioides acrostichi]|uniref:Uncharacterized protein n=1 Tax=Nocardioides acrostichi TaxID=2784339 RepID=A0A930V4K1_9ACTN|nr:hypothetical protein [Nocardioides acrostichi]MBF4163726.1 hypothetical protein [Nocardioides acrostichi]
MMYWDLEQELERCSAGSVTYRRDAKRLEFTATDDTRYDVVVNELTLRNALQAVLLSSWHEAESSDGPRVESHERAIAELAERFEHLHQVGEDPMAVLRRKRDASGGSLAC